MTYTGTALLAMVVELIVNYNVIRNAYYQRDPRAAKSYRGLILSMMAFFIFDAFWGVLYEKQLLTLVFTDTVMYFIAMAATVFFTTQYVICYLGVQNAFTKVLKYTGWVFIGFMTVSLVLNFFIQAMFWFDAAGNYHAGQFRYVALALQVLLFLSIAVAVLTTGARKGRSSRRRHLAQWRDRAQFEFVDVHKGHWTGGCLL